MYYLGFSHFLGIGPVRFTALKKHFGSVKKAYLAGKNELDEVIGIDLGNKFIEFRKKFDPVKKMEELRKKEIEVLCVDDEIYPSSLKNISDPPICVYTKGAISKFFITARDSPLRGPLESEKNLISPPILFAIVGTRNPTPYGIQVARKFSFELAKIGFTVVSGMAYGIDTISHKACLEAGGRTIAVLGCGVDIVYPAANRSLYNNILKKNGLIVSEYPPGQYSEKGFFILRNRIISGLSSGVLVVEGNDRSGSLITARYAADQGKNVFAVPGPITSEMSKTPNFLLKQGAKLVTGIEDILEEFDIEVVLKKEKDMAGLTEEEKRVYILLKEKPMRVDDLVEQLKNPISQVLNMLSVLEIKGEIERNSENCYQVRLT